MGIIKTGNQNRMAQKLFLDYKLKDDIGVELYETKKCGVVSKQISEWERKKYLKTKRKIIPVKKLVKKTRKEFTIYRMGVQLNLNFIFDYLKELGVKRLEPDEKEVLRLILDNKEVRNFICLRNKLVRTEGKKVKRYFFKDNMFLDESIINFLRMIFRYEEEDIFLRILDNEEAREYFKIAQFINGIVGENKRGLSFFEGEQKSRRVADKIESVFETEPLVKYKFDSISSVEDERDTEENLIWNYLHSSDKKKYYTLIRQKREIEAEHSKLVISYRTSKKNK